MTQIPNQTSEHSNDPAIEPWQLTAYALNELDPADAARVKRALQSDPALGAEFTQIKQTLISVRSALAKTTPNVKLNEKQTAEVSQHIEQAVAPKSFDAGSKIQLVERPFYLRKRFAALLATAAAIPLIVTWGPSWFDGGLSHSGPPTGVFHSSGDLDASVVPEMGMVIAKESKEDVKNAIGAIAREKEIAGATDSLSVASSDAPTASLAQSDSSSNFERVLSSKAGSANGLGGMSGVDGGVAESSPAKVDLTIPSSGGAGGGVRDGIEAKTDPLITGLSMGGGMGGMGGGGKGQGGEGFGFGESGGGPAGNGYPARPPVGGRKAGGVSGAKVDMGSPSMGSAGMGSAGYGSEKRARTEGVGLSVGGYGGGPPGGGYGGGSPGAPYNGGYPSTRSLAEAKPLSSATADVGGGMGGTGLPVDSLEDQTSRNLPDELRANVPHLFKESKRESSGTDRFERISEKPFVKTLDAPLSTFSIDVDTASYSKIRQTIMEGYRLPTPSMVRIEEMINYFEYEYAGPQDGRPFASHMTVDRCPWNPAHQLVRVGLQAKKLDAETRVKANIVFLIDVSGSMNESNKLPLVKKALTMLVSQLNENDRVAIVVYAGAAGCVLPSTCGSEKQTILRALHHLNAGGSTNGGQGIQLAYSIAKEYFIPGGANRVVLCTDGDFNVGVTGDDALVALMQENAKSNIFLTCLGFGAGNYNDTMMEKISNKGNGIYAMIDNELEARRMMVEQLGGTLVTVAKDVKIQMDFNPAKIAGYRLIGYEDRRLANQDFSDDKKDAGEIGAGHRVTALYEVIPVGKWVGAILHRTVKYRSTPRSQKPSQKRLWLVVKTMRSC